MDKFRIFNLVIFVFLCSCGGDDTPDPDPVVVDSTPPTITIMNTITEDNVISSDELSDFHIEGTTNAENGQTVELIIENFTESITVNATVSDGNWETGTINLQSFADGDLTFSAKVSDQAGNESAVATNTAHLDLNDVVLEISSPVMLDDLINSAEALVIRVTGSSNVEDDQEVSVLFTDGSNNVQSTAMNSSNSWRSSSANLSSLSNGNIDIVATVSNQNGERFQLSKTVELNKNQQPLSPGQDGTVWISANISTDQDPTLFASITPTGQGSRRMFDRRGEDWGNYDAWLFSVEFSHGLTIEAQVNPEFTEQEALAEATFYSREIGRLPKVLLRDLESLWIHKGNYAFGGGNNNFLIHTGLGDEELIPRGTVNEIFIHEGCHTSLDAYVYGDSEWEWAQAADGSFISEYAADNPNREDVAESFIMWLAYRYRPETINNATKTLIEGTMQYRMLYFDNLDIDLTPLIED